MIDLTCKADLFQSDLIVLCDAYLLIAVKSHLNQHNLSITNEFYPYSFSAEIS